MDFLAKPLPGRLAGLLEAVAVDVIKPAMIETAESAVFDSAVTQIGPAMRTMQPQQTRAASIVAKKDQILAQDPHRQRRSVLRQLFG
jgi:hypothetical protein